MRLTEEDEYPEGGARVTHVVPDSPADEAGLQPDDIIVGFDGNTIRGPQGLSKRIRSCEAGDDVKIRVLRGDESHELEAVLAGFLMGPDALARFAQEAPLYTDDQPELEFSWIEFPASGPERSDMLIVENARQIAAHQEGIAPHLGEPLDAAVLERIRHIRRSYVGHLFAIGYDNLATRAAAQGMVDEALRLYDEAIRAQPWFAQAHYNLGNLHVRLGKAEEALEIHQRAARLAPDLAEVQFAIAFDLHGLGRLQDSAEAYRAAIALHSDFADAYLNLARVEFQRGRSDEALAAIRAMLARDPAHAEAHRLLAELQAPTRE